MGIIEAVIMGLVQGLTEFLPISSSGHLVIAKQLLGGVRQPGILFEIMLHFGTLLAVLAYFRKEIASILEKNKNKHVIVKCDCEGAEFEIFERLNEENIISRIDVVMMEYHFRKPDRLIDILTENDFATQTKLGTHKSETGYIYAVRMSEKNP